MSKFDTHGGYFAPKDYLRVNEGGSHEENPNGGVQVGVDPEGTPNLLEEGEPVYKDYVYSDNIQAEKEFLEQNNLPAKYTGKLYSKIADDLFSEAEERPLDPISRNGLEALLGRLADAQEQQKQANEQRDLEDELSQLSPEELDQLEAMLARGEQEQMAQEQMPMEAAPEEQMMGPAEPMPVGGMPMMSNGGFLRQFDGGGSLTDEQKQAIIEQGPLLDGSGVRVPSLLETALGSDNKVVQAIDDAKEWWDNSTVGKVASFLIPEDATQAFGSPLMRQAGRVTGPIGRSVGRGLKKIGSAIKNAPGKLVEASGRKAMLQEAHAVVDEAKAVSSAARNTANAIADEVKVARANLAADPNNKVLQQTLAELEARSAKADVDALKASARTTRAQVEAANKTIGAFTGGPMYNRAALEKEVDGLQRAYESAKAAAEAAPNDKVAKETLEAAEKALEKAKGNWNKWWSHGEWQYKAPIGITAAGYKIAGDNKEKKQNWAEDQYANGGNLFVGGGPESILGKYLGVDSNGVPMFASDDIEPVVFTGYRNSSNPNRFLDENGEELSPRMAYAMSLMDESNGSSYGNSSSYEFGPYGSMMWMINPSMATVADLTAKREAAIRTLGLVNPSQTSSANLLAYPPVQDDSSSSSSNSSSNPVQMLPTWPRYAGAIGSGLLGLYNAFQSPDRYVGTRLRPVLPEGRINLQNQVYNPIDQNMIANAQIAQGNATNRALRNSGLGPSTGAAILAADNNLTGNLGTGFIQAWDANNQRRNAVIAANNQAEAQRAQFDYTVDAARKEAINRFAPYNAQNDLMIQRLNNEAEADKYTAISNQISNGLQALSGIGQENFAMNQVNTNPAYLGYHVGPNGAMFYNPNTGKWEKVKS